MAEPEYAKRLREARESRARGSVRWRRCWISHGESYNDLEVYDDEIVLVLSLQELVTLTKALGIDLVEFFADGAPRPKESVSLEALAEKINEYLATHNLTVAEFEEAVGWEVANCLADPSQIMNFNVDGLMDLSRLLGIDWRAVLAGLS